MSSKFGQLFGSTIVLYSKVSSSEFQEFAKVVRFFTSSVRDKNPWKLHYKNWRRGNPKIVTYNHFIPKSSKKLILHQKVNNLHEKALIKCVERPFFTIFVGSSLIRTKKSIVHEIKFHYFLGPQNVNYHQKTPSSNFIVLFTEFKLSHLFIKSTINFLIF